MGSDDSTHDRKQQAERDEGFEANGIAPVRHAGTLAANIHDFCPAICVRIWHVENWYRHQHDMKAGTLMALSPSDIALTGALMI